MTYTKDYLTKREEFKSKLHAVPVEIRKVWIKVLRERPKVTGRYFADYSTASLSSCGCCALGALRVACNPKSPIGVRADVWESFGFNGLVPSLNDYYKVPFSRFIKWIRESLKEPVKP